VLMPALDQSATAPRCHLPEDIGTDGHKRVGGVPTAREAIRA
jgi:hypothetical protein